MFDRALVPTDGSGPATAALELSIKIASTTTTVHLLYVSEVDETTDVVGGDELDASERAGDEILADASELARPLERPSNVRCDEEVHETEFSSTRRATTSISSSWALTDAAKSTAKEN
ncbi:Universal stress protein family protein [Natronorubrum sediminis]|uniref:Universal stress protein family protein n=1 Tax=Natronorubrum sediminis TaxID=640943 RepID=A0A1H6G4X0_9EURY|nr:universal stress protein [Natronorubrum sediminis]SEH18137.1 Universal stress protein family protein [Natronorubrum sediminis]